MSTTVKIPSIEVTFLFCNPLTLYYRVRYNRNSTHPISVFTFTKHTQKIEYEITSADDYDNSDSKISKEALTDFEEGETLFSLVHDLFSTMTIIFLDYIFQSSSLLKYIFIKQKNNHTYSFRKIQMILFIGGEMAKKCNEGLEI